MYKFLYFSLFTNTRAVGFEYNIVSNVVHHGECCFFLSRRETSPIIPFNWGQCAQVSCTSNFLGLSVLGSQALVFPCEREYFFFSFPLLSPSRESYE